MILYTFILALYIINECCVAMTVTEKRWCVFGRYVTSFLSGLYLLGSVALYLLHQFSLAVPHILHSVSYTDEGYFLRAIMGTAIALSMWANTYYRILGWAKIRTPQLYVWMLARLKTQYRRASEF
jgi:hypothetical protein